MNKAVSTDNPPQKRKIMSQVRNIHILTLVLIAGLITIITIIMIADITDNISEDFAHLYSIETMGKFNFQAKQHILLMQKVSRSPAVIGWFADEENSAKKAAAYNELVDHISILQSINLHFVIQESANEYMIKSGNHFEDFTPFEKLDPANPHNRWYYECIQSNYDYIIRIDNDIISDEQQVWVHHKIMKDDAILGVLCSGIPFNEMARNLFRQNNDKTRGYIVDSEGYIQMGSALTENHMEEQGRKNILEYTLDPEFHSEASAYFNNISHYFDLSAQPLVIKLAKDPQGYVSIVPIIDTNWSVVTFFASNSLYNITKLLPLLITMLVAFLIFLLVDSLFIYRFVQMPLNRLTNSLSASKFYIGEIYGCERDDEIGILAQTIQKMRDRLSTYNAELLRAARERERLIRIDQLTDIPNRRSFDERLPLEWGRAIRTKTPISLLILDLDLFKNYNDTYGHLQGDKALQVIAQIFTQELKRSGDLVARWGGEEFAILLTNTDFNGAVDVAERIRLRVENLQIMLIDGSISKMTISGGINSLVPTANDVLEDFIRHADMALYTAKREGRNRVCRYKGGSPAEIPASSAL